MAAEETSLDSEMLKELHRLRLCTTPEMADELLCLYKSIRNLQLEVKRISQSVVEVKRRKTLGYDEKP